MNLNSPDPADPSLSVPILRLAEVRYSLPALLNELKLERSTGGFAMEKLNQSDVKKLFRTKTAHSRAKKRAH
ncbi:MAG TPA: hypothetical protein VHF69_01705 [Candidatus Synoicihabitans sp.]|nr:hypothetical protein [Candidatus Synoicihabitans sp.]